MNLYSQRSYDANLLLLASGLLASTTTGSLIVDLGNGLVDADLILDVTALEVGSNDETYQIVLEGSPDATFGTAGNIMTLGQIVLGATGGAAMAPQGASDTIGRFLVPVRNERNGTTYRYARLKVIIAGTIATGINLSAWLAKDD